MLDLDKLADAFGVTEDAIELLCNALLRELGTINLLEPHSVAITRSSQTGRVGIAVTAHGRTVARAGEDARAEFKLNEEVYPPAPAKEK